MTVGRVRSTDGLGGGGGIIELSKFRDLDTSDAAWGLVGSAGLCSPVF
jgi:hypothetical protein